MIKYKISKDKDEQENEVCQRVTEVEVCMCNRRFQKTVCGGKSKTDGIRSGVCLDLPGPIVRAPVTVASASAAPAPAPAAVAVVRLGPASEAAIKPGEAHAPQETLNGKLPHDKSSLPGPSVSII